MAKLIRALEIILTNDSVLNKVGYLKNISHLNRLIHGKFIYLFFCRANLRNKHRTVGLCERPFTRGRHKSFYRRTERNALPLWTRNKCFSRFFYGDWASKGKSTTVRPSPAIREHRAWRNENPLVPSHGTFTYLVGSKRTHNTIQKE